MNFIDLFTISFSLLGGLLILRKDLTHLLLTLIQILLSIIVSVYEYQSVADSMLKGGAITQSIAEVISFIVIWLGVFITGALLIFLQRHIVEIKFKPWIEKPVGVLIGMIQVAILCFSLVFFILILPAPSMIQSISNNSVCTQALLDNLSMIYEKLTTHLGIEKKFNAERFLNQVNFNLKNTKSDEDKSSTPVKKDEIPLDKNAL